MKTFGYIAGVVLAGAVGFGLAFLSDAYLGERTTVTRLSPDEVRRASLVEPGDRAGIRTVQVRLESLVDRKTMTLYRSPRVGTPSGTERLIWSKDGSKLLLVGRHFFVAEDRFLDNGDQLYFLHDLRSGQSWSNAEPPDLAPLEPEQVKDVEFTEPVILKER